MKKGIRTIVSLCLCMTVYLSCFATYAYAFGDMNYVNVTPVKQATTTWCWAACSEMCGKTVAPESTRTQYDVVRYLNYPSPGTGYDIMKGCKYVALNKKEFDAELISFSICTEWAMKNEALVALCYYQGDPSMPGHALLINGTIFYDGDGGTTHTVYYIEPGDGKEYRCSYEGFCDGSENTGWVPQAVIHSV